MSDARAPKLLVPRTWESHPLEDLSPAPTARYLTYVVFIFFLVNMLGAMDRSVLSILIEPIRRELTLTDGQAGSLGFAFAIFYALFGMLLGRLTDTRSRTNLLSVSIALFSVATVISGMVQSFLQLFVARVGVGIGEAGSVPPKYSMVGDTFRPEHRASSLAIIQAGIGVGSIAGLALAGVLADTVGWRATFYIFGLPGVLLALCVVLTIKEPLRARFESEDLQREAAPSLMAALRSLISNTTFIFIVLAYSATIFAINGIGYWMPSFLIRSFHLSLSEVGLMYGSVTGPAFVVGLLISAALSPRLLRYDRRWEMWLPGIINLIVAGSYVALFTSQSLEMALFFAGVTTFLLGLTVGPASAAIQSIVSSRRRGVAVAVTMLISSLIGQGLGPWGIGLGSGMLSEAYGSESLRMVLMYTPIILVVGGVLYCVGARTFHRDRVD